MISCYSFRPVLALVLTMAVWLAAMCAATIIHVPPGSFFPPSFVVHSLMLALSIAAMWLISKGRLDLYGFTKGAYEFSPRILSWVLPTAVLSIVWAVVSPGGQDPRAFIELTKPQMIVFVWGYASICEETLVRGLLQTLLSRNTKVGAAVPHGLSMPVLVRGLFFGSMHIVLVKFMGVAARYCEKMGSLLPAIIVHALFNIGGTLPLWVIQWLRGLDHSAFDGARRLTNGHNGR